MAFNGVISVNYVIIGASAAGLSAAETLRRLAPDAEITLISREKEIAYSRCLLTYLLSGTISRDDIYFRSREALARLNLNIVSGTEVKGVNIEKREVSLSDGRQVHYDRLLAASGASPVIPDGIKGVSGQGVYTLRTLEDADRITKNLGEVSGAVILGDGLVSVTAAQALNSRGVKVTIVGIAPHILATFLDRRSAEILQEKLTASGIELMLGRTFAEVRRGADGKLKGVAASDGKEFQADIVIIAVGVKPEFSFLKDSGINSDRGLTVNEYLETSVPGIYAAGDVAQGYDRVRETIAWQPLWPNAVEQGRTAGYNMAGVEKCYGGCTNLNSLNIAGTPVICVGQANTDRPGLESFVLSDNGSTYEKIVFAGNKLAGFILLGKTEKAGVITSLVYQGDLSPTQKEKLLNRKFSYTSLSGLTPVGN